MEREEFVRRMVQLRMNKGVSARDMSLSLGQSENYINEIENGKAYPSMQAFFYICDYLSISPRDFFDFGTPDPQTAKEVVNKIKGLPSDKLAVLMSVLDSWSK